MKPIHSLISAWREEGALYRRRGQAGLAELAESYASELEGAIGIGRAPLATTPSPAPTLLHAPEVAERLRLNTQRVYALCRSGKLPHVRLGRQVRVSPIALEEFIAAGGF